jgi:hypothetical protein
MGVRAQEHYWRTEVAWESKEEKPFCSECAQLRTYHQTIRMGAEVAALFGSSRKALISKRKGKAVVSNEQSSEAGFPLLVLHREKREREVWGGGEREREG